MRCVLSRVALITVVFALSATSIQAQAADPFQWVGVTTTNFDGDDGFLSMTTACRTDFGSAARMCSSVEILESNTLIPDIRECWVRAVFQPVATGTLPAATLDSSGVFLDGLSRSTGPENFTCNGWSTNSSNVNALVLKPSGGFQVRGCGGNRPVACCAPVPVPEPAASLSIPVGAMGLMLLSSLRG
jgi:hypothetical protein